MAIAAAAAEPGSAAVMIVHENRWAAPFAAAVRRSGGVLVANERISGQAVIDGSGALKDQGVLTEDEFASEKARILSS